MKRVLFLSMISLGLTILAGAGCGGKVVVDLPAATGGGGAGGASSATGMGGIGGALDTSSVADVGVTVGSSSSVAVSVSSVGSGPVSTSVSTAVSSSSGGSNACDNSGDCNTCANCSIDAGGSCEQIWNKCLVTTVCNNLITCLSSCDQNPACQNKCFQSFPQAQQMYQDVVICAVCTACPNDCPQQGCPG